MEYRAVGNRCAVDIEALQLPISHKEALNLLASKGFSVVEVDLIALARKCIGESQYRRGARPSEAPSVVDCSSLMKWLYGQLGIWLPRRSIQQRELGETIQLDEIIAGDLVFTSSWLNYYLDNPSDGVGHVGIATNDNMVIHAANKKAGVIETPLSRFVSETTFRGARRYIPKNREIFTLETPTDREVESADDIKWIVLQSLPKISF
ncbi:MAG: NlpC/P60 family protein [Candidatus Wildermuthbacteria bacterium]|nr:NlpC/P60 family protein [Candidatus Wildermuthbacteria bacterium]